MCRFYLRQGIRRVGAFNRNMSNVDFQMHLVEAKSLSHMHFTLWVLAVFCVQVIFELEILWGWISMKVKKVAQVLQFTIQNFLKEIQQLDFG